MTNLMFTPSGKMPPQSLIRSDVVVVNGAQSLPYMTAFLEKVRRNLYKSPSVREAVGY